MDFIKQKCFDCNEEIILLRPNMYCIECGSKNIKLESYKNPSIREIGFILDQEIENANYHSFCGLGMEISKIIQKCIIDEELSKDVMMKISDVIYKMI